MPRPSTQVLLLLIVIAACGGKVLTGAGGSGNQGDQGTAAGTSSGTFGSGTGSSGATTGSPGTGIGSSGTGTGSTGTGTGSSGTGTGSPGTGTGTSVTSGAGGAFVGTGGDTPTNCVAPTPSTAQVAGNLLSDLETDTAVDGIVPGGAWFSYRDSEPDTAFLPDPGAFTATAPGLNGTKMAVHVLGKGFTPPASATNWGGGVGMALSILGPTLPGATDLSAYEGISFWAKSGSAVSDISVQVSTTDTDPNYCTCAATASCYASHSVLLRSVPQVDTKYTVRWADLRQPTYIMAPVPFNPTQVLTINFATNGPVPHFDYWVDEVSLVK